MEKDNIFSQMAQYDFSTPINITMIFEDDMDGSNNGDLLEEQTEISTASTQETLHFQKAVQPNILSISNMCNRLLDRDKTDNSIRERYFPNAAESVHINNNSISPNENINIIEARERYHEIVSETCHQTKENEDFPSTVQNMLETVSQHLIVVMGYYYHNSVKNKSAEFQMKFNLLKGQFFDLSYSTVVSIILPQENNEVFSKRIIDQIVVNANKTFQWKCEPRHVKPFYKELIRWVKLKRESIKKISMRRQVDPILKERLMGPPQKMNFPINSPEIANDGIQHNQVASYADNNICLFSSGVPGQEISINILPETLSSYLPNNTKTPTKRKKPNLPQDCQNISIQARQDEGQVRCAPQNCHSVSSIIHYKPLVCQAPPPYYNIEQNYRIAQTNLVCSAVQPQYHSQNVGQHFAPVITNVTSLNPVPLLVNGSCCICGKPTITKCSKCNRFSYCSALCQELDTGKHKNTCS